MFVPMVTTEQLEAHQPPITGHGRWFVTDGRSNILLLDGEIPSGATPPIDGGIHLMGVDRGVPVWAVQVEEGSEPPPTAQWLHLRQLYGSIEETDWALAGRAVQILAWDRDHRFCGRCGAGCVDHANDRAKECEACGLIAYPRLTPAVIVLVEREDGRALLAWGAQFPGRFFSALAGFVEPGESLEECVRREIGEEVGITVDDINYFGSQPWPFPHSLMIGFTARYTGGELTPQESEIVEAGWYHHDELPPAPRGGMSIAGWLIEDWIKRQARP